MPNKQIPLHSWPAHEVKAYLEGIGEPVPAARARGMGLNPFGTKKWKYSGMVIGYVSPGGTGRRPVVGVQDVQPERELIGTRIKLTMDGLYVHDYPGGGPHRVLCEFSGRNQTDSEAEDLKFACEVTCGAEQRAAINGKPIFHGLVVGPNGISFSGKTINVRSKTDDQILTVLNSGAFSSGLSLLSSVQPALKPFVGLATGFIQTALSRSENAMVQDFNLGLDFDGAASSARLRLGTYIVIQAPNAPWNWDFFEWESATQAIYDKGSGNALRLNYMTFGISPFM
ncbi:hypothetical protein [Aureimonas pseudogalii]|uniref:Uncharacterized protein n=1 Tax=Aureimonas pseudogalii TaxID=1744844 RepID=A0A7W6EDS2_9HYPH|nr:hypothetical protein [Aureimonas pseudogalii]MBB3997482.1 hypothetical protein [Aureimonas pseudogalii]